MERFGEFLLAELWAAYKTARKGKRYTVDEHRFELNAMENIIDLRDSIVRHYYKPNRGVAFIVHDPVTREIVAAPFRDRVVHHFLYNICGEWWDRRFLPDSYSCRKGKGTLYAQERMQKHLRQAIRSSTERRAYIAKLDLQGYFMSLNHEKLYRRVAWGVDRQLEVGQNFNVRCAEEDRERLKQVLKYLWYEVIFDKPMQNITIRGRRSDWRGLPATKSLFKQPAGQGIVIGNLTSQLLSNIFMDQFDRYVRFELGYKHYGRYVDDFFIIVPWERREQLLRDVPVMEKYLKREMDLTLHPKKRFLQEAGKGIPFVGAVIYEDCKIPGRRMRRNCYAAAYRLATHGEGKIDGLVSRVGSMAHLDSQKFIPKMLESFGWNE